MQAVEMSATQVQHVLCSKTIHQRKKYIVTDAEVKQESISYSERKTTADIRPLISSGIDIKRTATLVDTAGQEVHFEDEHTVAAK